MIKTIWLKFQQIMKRTISAIHFIELTSIINQFQKNLGSAFIGMTLNQTSGSLKYKLKKLLQRLTCLLMNMQKKNKTKRRKIKKNKPNSLPNINTLYQGKTEKIQ